ncbi:MAG: uroporphyrinogen decarboxylase family protein [Candidatus Bathyarchaeia archaeon]
MNPRERALTALEHREPDRVPLEGVAWGEWSYPFMLRLLAHLGIEGGRLTMAERQDALAERLGIDFRAVGVDPPASFREVATYNQLFHYPWGIEVANDVLEDEWGVRRTLNATRLQSRVIYHPLRGKTSLEGYVFPDAEAPGRFDAAERLLKNWRGKYAVSGIHGGDAYFCQGWYIRGFTELLRDLYANPGFAEELFDGLQSYFLPVSKRLAEMGIDVLCIADDVAMQTGMIISPRLWRRFIKPRMKAVVEAVKSQGCHVLFHTDGDCEAIIPDLIEIGVDALNPIQPECMDPARIKRLYGDKLTLSGTISVQRTLPMGSLQDVEEEVKTRLKTCGRGGGLILAPTNQALLDIKVENFLAVYETAQRWGRYPLVL